jgi:hypothetical protein
MACGNNHVSRDQIASPPSGPPQLIQSAEVWMTSNDGRKVDIYTAKGGVFDETATDRTRFDYRDAGYRSLAEAILGLPDASQPERLARHQMRERNYAHWIGHIDPRDASIVIDFLARAPRVAGRINRD